MDGQRYYTYKTNWFDSPSVLVSILRKDTTPKYVSPDTSIVLVGLVPCLAEPASDFCSGRIEEFSFSKLGKIAMFLGELWKRNTRAIKVSPPSKRKIKCLLVSFRCFSVKHRRLQVPSKNVQCIRAYGYSLCFDK